MSIKDYTSESIQVLSDLEHIRLRKGMYVGGAEDPRQLLSEIFDNGMDEVQAGFSNELIVYINTDKNEYRVRDFGRGIPHGKKTLESGEEREIIAVLLTKSNSGGKFVSGEYSTFSSGLNGLGLTITNALSNYISITSYRKGKFVRGTAFASDNVNIEYGKSEDEPNGTDVVFQPNESMFADPVVPISFIKERCEVASSLGFRARLFIDNEEVPIKSSIFDLMKEDDKSIAKYVDVDPFDVAVKSGEKMKVAIRYTSDVAERYFGYTNMLSNYLGGTHVQETSKAISAAWKEFIDRNKRLKPSVELKDRDYLVGIRCVCAAFISSPEYSSQTKEKLVNNKKYFAEFMEKFSKMMVKYLENNIVVAQQLLKRFEEFRIAQNSLLSRKEISSIIKINEDSDDNIRRRSVVSKLVECTSRKRAGTEMFIVEGLSALGPYLHTRNKETQAVLPLKGKILNVSDKDVKSAIKNNEVCDIINAIGCGIGAQCDASKARYDKVIISADSDDDGLHIACLLMCLFVNLLPDFVQSGKLFISTAPLYCWETGKGKYSGCDKIEEIPKSVKNFHRIKGLGEFNDDQLAYFLVNPSTRRLLRVDYPADVDEFNRIMSTSNGKYDLLIELGILSSGGGDCFGK